MNVMSAGSRVRPVGALAMKDMKDMKAAYRPNVGLTLQGMDCKVHATPAGWMSTTMGALFSQEHAAATFDSGAFAIQPALAPVTTIHSKAPLRLGLAGGGTDVAPYSDLYGGHVLNSTISLFTHCHIETTTDGLVAFDAADFHESVALPLTSAIKTSGRLVLHGAVYNRMVRQFRDGEPLGVRVTTYSDAPPGSGVGTSSSLVVAMVQAYVELLKLSLGEYDVAHLAYEIERIDCAMAGGKQDQYAAAFGGFNFIEFSANDRVVVNPLRLRPELANELESRLLLFYTGLSRESARIIEAQIAATRSSEGGAAIDAMHSMKRAATDMKESLLKGRIAEVLDILGESWTAKKRAAVGISNDHIDSVAAAALAAGARGLKISGAGGGGFMMIAVDSPQRHSVVRALENFGGRFFAFTFVDHGVRSWKSR
jgi:D-glycero-alpha-D-manno-heptose-7-phosphate kinase